MEAHVVAAHVVDVVEALLNIVETPWSIVETAHIESKKSVGKVRWTASYVATTTFTCIGSPARYQSMNHAPITTTAFPVCTRRFIPHYLYQI